MTSKYPSRPQFFLGLGFLLLLAGCATPGGSPLIPAAEMRVNELGQVANTGFDAIDLVKACNQMHDGMGSLPEFNQKRGRVRIAVEPVVNDTRFTIDKSTFDDALLGQLKLRAPRQWGFLKGSELAADEPVDFYLTNRLQRLMPLAPTDHEILLFSFQLINARNSETNWEGSAEIRNFTVEPVTGS